MKTETKQVGILNRNAVFEKNTIDEEARTVELAFSSEEPVSRWDGEEILDHDPKSIRLGRLKDAGPLLVDHDPADHVGVIESVSVDSDRRGRATVRFGRSPRATDVFNDVVDGIRKSISVGYRVYKAVAERSEKDVPVYRVTDWEPLEISFVSIPADATSKVGRSDTTLNKFTIRSNKTMSNNTQEKAAPEIDLEVVKSEARQAEQARVRSINEIGDKLKVKDLARQFSDNGKSVDEFMRVAIDATAETLNKPADTLERNEPVKADIGMTGKEVKTYSLMRAINAAASGDWSKAGFEKEVSMAAAEAYGREARGFWVPDEILGRDMTTASDGTGLKGTVTTGYIDKLYDNSLAISLGADVLTGLVGDLSVPALTAGSTVYYVAENADITEADATVGSVGLDPKTMGIAVPISRLLRRQSTPSIDNVIQNNILREIGLAIDFNVLEGGGTAQATGIINTTSVPTSTIASAGTPTRTELIEFETDVAAGNGLAGNLAFVTTSAVRGNMKSTAIDSGSGLFLCSDANQAVGYNVHVSNQLTANSIIFGNFQDVYVGFWGGTDIVIDDATNAASGGIVMRAFQDFDVAVKHAASFAINA